MQQYQKAKNYFIEDLYPLLVNYFPPQKVRPGHCLSCANPLSTHEMSPIGHPPRYMCRSCYENIAYNWPTEKCLACGGQLPLNKIQRRRQNPRELTHALHDGTCEDYHSVLAGIVFGLPFKRRESKTATPLLAGSSIPALSFQKRPVAAIPFQNFSSMSFNIPNLMRNSFDLVPARVNQTTPTRYVRYLKLP